MQRYNLPLLALIVVSVYGCGGTTSELPTPGPPKVEAPRPLGADDIVNQKFASPLSVQDAETILSRTNMFVWNHGPALQIDAYRVLMQQPDALRRVLSIASHGGRAGQLYALCALRDFGSEAAWSVANRLASVEEEILVHGSNGATRFEPVTELVREIETNKACITLRSQ